MELKPKKCQVVIRKKCFGFEMFSLSFPDESPISWNPWIGINPFPLVKVKMSLCHIILKACLFANPRIRGQTPNMLACQQSATIFISLSAVLLMWNTGIQVPSLKVPCLSPAITYHGGVNTTAILRRLWLTTYFFSHWCLHHMHKFLVLFPSIRLLPLI